MRVAAEIGQHLVGAAKGRLGVDDPFDFATRGKMSGEGQRLREFGKITEEAQFSGLEGGPEILQEQPAEEPGEHADRQKEAGPAGDPA